MFTASEQTTDNLLSNAEVGEFDGRGLLFSASGVCPSLPSVLGSGLPRITSHRSFSNAKKSIGWWAWQRDVILKVAHAALEL